MRGLVCLGSAVLLLGSPLRAQTAPSSAPAQAAQAAAPPTRLTPGTPVERTLHGGEAQVFVVHAEAGQFVRVVVVQKGIDVAVTLLDPAGRELTSSDSLNWAFGPEAVSAIAETTGDYQVKVQAGDAPPGRVDVRPDVVRAPTDADRTRMAAERRYMDGIHVYLGDTKAPQRTAIEKWQQSRMLWKSLDDAYGQALSLESAGIVSWIIRDFPRAANYYSDALPLWRAAGAVSEEATTLANLGRTYAEMGEKRKALDAFARALPLNRAAGDPAGEGATEENLGEMYFNFGDTRRALEHFSLALPLQRATHDRSGEALSLNIMGLVHSDLGDQPTALAHLAQALQIRRELGERGGEAVTVLNMAAAEARFGEKQKALEHCTHALEIARSVGDVLLEGRVLNNTGLIYASLGQTRKALDYHARAASLLHPLNDPGGEGAALNNVGLAYTDLGETPKALDHFQRALPLYRTLGYRFGEARTLTNIGIAYARTGEYQKALDYYAQALPLACAVGDRYNEARTVHNTGLAEAALGQGKKALDRFADAVSRYRDIRDPIGEARVLVSLMEYWDGQGRRPLAVLFGKQAIDRLEQVRRNIQGLPADEQQSFVRVNERAYRQLAGLLVSQGRLPEAQEVLDLLKLEEHAGYSGGRRGLGAGNRSVTLTRAEGAAKQLGDPIQNDLAALGREWFALDTKPARTAEEQARYDDLSVRLEAANRGWKQYLNGLYKDFGSREDANRRVATVRDESRGLQNLLGGMEAGTVGVYTLVLDEKCVLMVITPAVRVAREVRVTRSALRPAVFDFVRAIGARQPEKDLLPKARDLYRALVAPIERDLEQAHAKTIVWSLDDVLRYLPLAALHDGKQFLAERFANVVITTTGLVNLALPTVDAWHGLAMGVSKDYEGLGALAGVPGELDAVITSASRIGSHGPVPGTILLDDSFTEKEMQAALARRPPVVHVATHFVLNPGDDEASYLLLGGKDAGGKAYHLSLADLDDDVRIKLTGVELLTLSACQTGMASGDSDGREMDSLGMVAQKKGAKAVIATLWPVDDASTAMLMETFYRLWTTKQITKSEALRQAQLTLLHGNRAVTARYANPFYWAPFILIGNWK